MTRELGRRHAPDDRDRLFLAREVIRLPALTDCPVSRYWFNRFNQDQTGSTCVANAWTHRLGDSPRTWPLAWLDTITDRRILTNDQGDALGSITDYRSPQSSQQGFRGILYDQAQLVDEWSDTPPEGGTSVRAAAKVLQRWGFLSEYRWLLTGEEVLRAVLSFGPVVIGVTWYEAMMTTPNGGWLEATGGIAGGHSVVVDGANRKLRKVRIQTWGTHFWMTLDTLSTLIADQGEACIPIEVV